MKRILAALAMFGLSTLSAVAQDVPHAKSIAPDDHVLGVAAPHDLIIYASVTCPHCADFFATEWDGVRALAEAGEIRVAFREMPSAPAQIAVAGFMLANCGGADGYFDHIEYQMDMQSTIREAFAAGSGRDAFLNLARKAGLEDEAAMTACFADDAAYAPIARSMDRAEAAQLASIPAFILDGQVLDGPVTVERLRALIEPPG